MAEYIDREKALDIARGTPAYYYLKNAPTADVVKVVRCKDCVYVRESNKTNKMFCAYHGDDYEFETYPHKYCSDGVKAKLKECEGK